MNLQYKISGARELSALLRRLPAEVGRRALRQAALAGGAVVRREARIRAPVRRDPRPKRIGKGGKGRLPGYLRANIRSATIAASDRAVHVQVGIGAAFYGVFDEFGTSHQPAHPWLRPAWEASREKALLAIARNLAGGLKREAERLAGIYRSRRRR